LGMVDILSGSSAPCLSTKSGELHRTSDLICPTYGVRPIHPADNKESREALYFQKISKISCQIKNFR